MKQVVRHRLYVELKVELSTIRNKKHVKKGANFTTNFVVTNWSHKIRCSTHRVYACPLGQIDHHGNKIKLLAYYNMKTTVDFNRVQDNMAKDNCCSSLARALDEVTFCKPNHDNRLCCPQVGLEASRRSNTIHSREKHRAMSSRVESVGKGPNMFVAPHDNEDELL